MKTPIPATQDTSLNMTPMIDIVFQLILFFLFSLKFKSLDWRIESMLPHGYGPNRDFKVVEILPHRRIALTRVDPDDPARARTRLRMSGYEWDLPDAANATEAERAHVLRSLEARLRALHAELPLPGQIDCPPPTGALVPHGDVMAVLDAFLEVKITDVDFQGTPSPLPSRGRR